ncbi:surface layer protein [Aeropyrum pernix]|uniref:Surface layer protein n=1 Tax=Aeropyrum pernix TaxID=56636 RepID=A0A401H975_AERPX|nr:hypothetical protein [Aeropyrum pernix]GBF08918.1 surface layer protein [Aeropyrum pernix]
MRHAYTAMAALLLAVFLLPAIAPIAQMAAALSLGEETFQINPGFTGRELVIDPDMAASLTGDPPVLNVNLIAVTIRGSGFQDDATLQYWIQRGTTKFSDEPFDFATPIGVYGGDGAPMKQVQGGWLSSPSINKPPTLVVEGEVLLDPEEGVVKEGVYHLYVTDGTNERSMEFRVLDIVPGNRFPMINSTNPASVLSVDSESATQDIKDEIPVYQPGDTVEFTISGLPANVTGVQVFLDWIGSPYRGTASPMGGSYEGSIRLPSELPMGIHIIMALIYFDQPATPTPIPSATIAFLPIYIKPKLVSGPFIIQGNEGDTVNLQIVGLPESTPVGDDIDVPPDDITEVAWAINEFTSSPTYHLIGEQTITSPEGTLNVTVQLESDIAPQHRGALTLYLWDDITSTSTIVWNGGITPDTNVIREIKFEGVLIASLPDVPPSFTPGDSRLAVFIDGRAFPGDTTSLYPCLSSVKVVVFNTLANATVNFYLGPFLLGTATTNSLGVAVLEVAPIGPIPGVSGTTNDYTFTAVATRGSYFDNINFDSTDYVNIVPWADYDVSVGGGFFYPDTKGGIWAAEGTTFVITICGLEPYETAKITKTITRDEVVIDTVTDETMADNMGVAVYNEEAPDLSSEYSEYNISISIPVSEILTEPVYKGGDHPPSTPFSLVYRVPEQLDITLYYQIYSDPDTEGTVVGTVGYSTDEPGDALNSGPSDTLQIIADRPSGLVPGLVYELLIGGQVIQFTSDDFDGGTTFAPDITAPSQTGVYTLGIEAMGFDFLEAKNYDFYFLVVSDPLSLSPQIVQLYPDSNEISAGKGGVLFAAFNFTSDDRISVRSPTIETPGLYPGRFSVLGPTGFVTQTADKYEVSVDNTGAVLFTAEQFMTPATTHTLHMSVSGRTEGLFTFNIKLLEYWDVSTSASVQAGEDISINVEAYGVRAGGWYRAVLLDPVTLEPLEDLRGDTFASDPFQADLEGTIIDSDIYVETSILIPLGTVFRVGIFDVQTGELVALAADTDPSDEDVDATEVTPAGPYDTELSTYVLTPLTAIDLTIEGFDLELTTYEDPEITSVGVQIGFYSLTGDPLFETVGVAKQYSLSGGDLVGATFLVPIPNFEDEYAGTYAMMVVEKIVVQIYDNTEDNVDFQFAVTGYQVGVVKLGADGGVLVNITAVLNAIEGVESKVEDLTLAVNDGFTNILLKLDDMTLTLTDVQNGVAQLQTDVGVLQASVDDLATLVQQTGDDVKLHVTVEADRVIAEITNGVATIQGDLQDIMALLDQMNATLVSIEDGVAELQTTAGTILVSVQDLQTIIADSTDAVLQALDDKVAIVLDGQAEILASLDELDAKVTEVRDGVVQLQTSIGTIQTTVEDLAAMGAEINDVVVENNQLLATITTSMGTLTADVSTIRDLIESGVNVKIDQVLESLSSIADQNAQLAAQAQAIAQTLAAVQDDTAKITDIQSTLASVAGDVASVKQDTSTISSKLDDANGKLDSISSKVDSVSSAVADIQEQLGQVGDTAESASGRAQTWGIINAVLSLAVLGVAGYLVLQLTRRE